jgi:hypothetical protein
MAHIDEGMLQAYLDEEVGARAEIDAHLRSCGECAARLEELRGASRLFAAAVHAGDVAAPAFAAFTAIRRAQEPQAAPRRSVARVPLTRAAVLLIGFAAVASATVPGSPVRDWLSDALRSIGVLPDNEQPAVPVVPDSQASAGAVEQGSGPAALSILPSEGRLRIVLSDVSSAATVRVRMIEGERALVQASGDAARARFRTGPGRIELIGIGKGEIIIDVPDGALDVRVESDGKVLFEKVR